MNTDASKEIMARNIKRYMDSRGISNQKLCEDLGFKYTTFMDWIKGVTYPRIGKIEAMADYFGIQKSDLIEEKLTDEQKAGNEALAGIIVRLRMDADFRLIVETLNALDADKLKGVQQMLNAFAK